MTINRFSNRKKYSRNNRDVLKVRGVAALDRQFSSFLNRQEQLSRVLEDVFHVKRIEQKD